MAENIGADPLGPLIQAHAAKVLAAIRTDELPWDQIVERTGLLPNALETVIVWMSRRGEIEERRNMKLSDDGTMNVYWATWRLPDDRRLAYALEMAQGTQCKHRSTRAISRGRMVMSCNVCGAERDRLGVWTVYRDS